MLSLLWPQQPAGNHPRPPASRWMDDLDIDQIVRAIDRRGQRTGFVRAVLGELCCDAAVIGARQDLIEDLVRLPDLAAALERTLPALAALAQPPTRWGDDQGVFGIAPRVAELELYIDTLGTLHTTLDAAHSSLQAAGLIELHAALGVLLADEETRALAAELPALRAQLDQAGSITLGINLDAALRPESATILALSSGRFDGPRTLLGRLLRGGDRDAGLFPLRQAGERQPFSPERQLFRDLQTLLEGVTAPVAGALARYRQVQAVALGLLEPELTFLLGAAGLVRELRAAGYELTRPALAPLDERICCVTDAYSLPLALRMREMSEGGAIVASDICMGEQGRVLTLSGPNRGGKTTYTRAVGLVHVLAQAGLPVPGSAARVSPVDIIATLFPSAERARPGMGRLDEEAALLAGIFQQATPHSLVLLNEPLTSTSPDDALLLGRDLLCGLRALGCRALFVTHLHDLAREAPGLNDTIAGKSQIGCLVAEVVERGSDRQATFRIIAGQPGGKSYAATIAEHHGLRLAQIVGVLERRGLA